MDQVSQEIEKAKQFYDLALNFMMEYSFQIVGALLILVMGLIIAQKIHTVTFRICQKKQLDITFSRFLATCIKFAIITMVIIIALSQLGISITPLIATIGAISLGAGLAIQGLVSNYGAGLSIIVTRPFVVGDTIKVKGVTGVVQEVRLGFTLLSNEDNVEISIPNKHIIGEIIHNSHKETLAEQCIGIAYNSDYKQAIEVIKKALESIEELQDKRSAQVGISEFADSAINISLRYWAPSESYYQTCFKVNSAIFDALLLAKIEIPFPQMDLRIQR